MDNPHDRIDVDPIILSAAAVACGYTIRDFYEKPELGIHCVGYISHLYDLLPVTHWFFSLPWVTELGLKLVYKETLPPISTGPIYSAPEDVDKMHVPSKEELVNAQAKYGQLATVPMFYRIYDYVTKNLPMTLVPISYGFDLVGAAAEMVGVENFIMWTFTEPEAADKLVDKYTQTSINGAEALADKYGSAMLIVGSVLANNDIFNDEGVERYSVKNMYKYVDGCFKRGAGPQVFYHLCGNHETDYKLFRDGLMWSPFTVFHVGYKGRNPFPSSLLKQNFQDRATCMGSVDTKLMIDPNPNKVYNQAKEQLLGGRDSKKGYILGTSCETPPYTIPGQMLALVKAARDFGTYGTW
ncbi:MAG TPA: uroporphyrinogen decarboxylase family protein [Methanomassiliicoccales archaeon]|nr:uroporphyrinogen decarboxylase family protein [Methanomassiliicoccales archaeon]